LGPLIPQAFPLHREHINLRLHINQSISHCGFELHFVLLKRIRFVSLLSNLLLHLGDANLQQILIHELLLVLLVEDFLLFFPALDANLLLL
jgi:hypothetical protein